MLEPYRKQLTLSTKINKAFNVESIDDETKKQICDRVLFLRTHSLVEVLDSIKFTTVQFEKNSSHENNLKRLVYVTALMEKVLAPTLVNIFQSLDNYLDCSQWTGSGEKNIKELIGNIEKQLTFHLVNGYSEISILKDEKYQRIFRSIIQATIGALKGSIDTLSLLVGYLDQNKKLNYEEFLQYIDASFTFLNELLIIPNIISANVRAYLGCSNYDDLNSLCFEKLEITTAEINLKDSYLQEFRDFVEMKIDKERNGKHKLYRSTIRNLDRHINEKLPLIGCAGKYINVNLAFNTDKGSFSKEALLSDLIYMICLNSFSKVFFAKNVYY